MWVGPHQQALDVWHRWTGPVWRFPNAAARRQRPMDERLAAFERAMRNIDPATRAERKARIREAFAIPPGAKL
jgi:hypothetical protein